MKQFDVIIIGGGLAGAGLDIALRNTPLRMALIEARLPTHDDPRLFALSLSSCHFLQQLGLWPELNSNASPINQVHISNQGYFGTLRLRCTDLNLSTLGYMIPARFLEAALNA